MITLSVLQLTNSMSHPSIEAVYSPPLPAHTNPLNKKVKKKTCVGRLGFLLFSDAFKCFPSCFPLLEARLQNGRHSNRATSLVNYYRIELRAQCHKFVYQALLCKSHVQKGWRWSDGKRSISFLLFRDSMTMEIKLHLVVALKWLVILWWAKKKDKTWWLFMKLVQPSRDMDFGVTWSKFAPPPQKKKEKQVSRRRNQTHQEIWRKFYLVSPINWIFRKGRPTAVSFRVFVESAVIIS